MTNALALEINALSKSFGGVSAVNAVSFDVKAGELTALIGPNGAGKTTLFNLITNFFTPDEGNVLYFGQSLHGMSSKSIAAMGLMRTFQSARIFPGMTTLENIMVGAHLRVQDPAWSQMLWTPRARENERTLQAQALQLLELVGLSKEKDSAASDLPMGAQKILEVVRALMGKPKVLLLDEPAAGLNDSETAELACLLKAITQSGITVVVVEHNMSLVMGVADHIVVLDAGKLLAQGTPVEMQNNPQVIEAYIGKEEVSEAPNAQR
jgi:branched-chain amino acid transport system ATP-binding protein